MILIRCEFILFASKDNIMGGVSDNIVIQDGTRISGEFMTTIFDDNPDLVKQFRVMQRKDHSIEIEVIANTSYFEFEQALKTVETGLSKKLQEQVPVQIKLTDSMPLKKGKIRFIESECC